MRPGNFSPDIAACWRLSDNPGMKLWLSTLAMLLMCAVSACAAVDTSAADCVNDATVRLAGSEGSRLTATCTVPESIVVIAMPPASRVASESDYIPKEIRVLITQSRNEGYNWCAFPRDELATLITTGGAAKLRYECRRVLAELLNYSVTAGRAFRIELRRAPSGNAEVTGIKGDTEFESKK
jgi:hypothetical protein